MKVSFRAFLSTSLLIGFAGSTLAEETLAYGSRVGMDLQIVSKSGIGTSNAVVVIEHTPENAQAFCAEYLGDYSVDCVRRTMAEVQVQPAVTADCEQGQWTDAFGQQYELLGRNRSDDAFAPEYDVIRMDTGEILNGSSASGYDTALGVLVVLCSGIAEPRGQTSQSAYEAEALKYMESYFSAQPRARLFLYQTLMMGQGSADGLWGQETSAAFADKINMYTSIGGSGEDWGILGEHHVPRFLRWIEEASYASTVGAEFPD